MSDTSPTAEPAKAPPRFVRDASSVVPLSDSVQYDGQEFASITVRKLSIGAFRRHTEGGGSGQVLGLPMYEDANGAPVPVEVMDALSMPDAEAVTEVAQGFLNKPSPVAPGT